MMMENLEPCEIEPTGLIGSSLRSDEASRLHRDLLPRVAKEALSYLEGLSDRPVRVPDAKAALERCLGGELPLASSPAGDVLDQLLRGADLGICPSGSGRYLGYVRGGTLPIGLAADWLTSAWDQCGTTFGTSPLTAVLEEVCGDWLVSLFGLPRGTSVSFTPASTYASLLSLTVARHSVLARHGWDVSANGLHGAPRVTVLINDTIHPSILRSLIVLGLTGNTHRVPTDGHGRMRPRALAAELHKAAGDPLIVCGNLGEINTGAVEDLHDVCIRVHEAGGWVHLDGAFGLWAAATNMRHTLLSGLDLADSWSTDAHKWLNVPYDCGIALITDATAHRDALEVAADYLNLDDAEHRHPMQWGLEHSRRARVIPVWAVLRQLGKNGIARMVERHCAQAKHLATRLSGEAGIEIVNEVCLNQVAVRFHHPSRDSDTHTKCVAYALQQQGVSWASTSRWNSQTILRLSVINWATTDDDIDETARSLISCHRSLIESDSRVEFSAPATAL